MQGQKTLSFSYNMHLFLPYLLNDSQTIHSTIHFSKPLLCVTLICGDWSISFKAVFVIVSSADLCKAITGETDIFNAPTAAPSGNKWAGNMLMFHFDVNMKRLGIRIKKRLVSMIQSRIFLLRGNKFIHGALSDLKLCRMFSFT